MLQKQLVEFSLNDTIQLDAYIAYDDQALARCQKLAAVLVFHDYKGRKDFECSRADALASLGKIFMVLHIRLWSLFIPLAHYIVGLKTYMRIGGRGGDLPPP